jgi:DNA-binding NarL/FixJ family response regulator
MARPNGEASGEELSQPFEPVILAIGRVDGPMKHGRVLLADSHLNMLGGVHSLLDTLFETVLMVADESSLDDAVTTLKPDLVVVDLSLPCEGEADIARRLMRCHPDLRLIVLSVHDEPTVARELLGAGVAGFVLKRSAGTDMLPAVEEVLRGGTYVSPGIRSDMLESQGPSVPGTNHTPGG